MASDKKPKPVRKYSTGGDDKGSRKKPPQPVRRVHTGGSGGSKSKSAPKPVRRSRTGSGTTKRRVRPSVRAARHQTKVKARPMPKPPKRRVVRRTAAGAAAAGAAAAAASREASPEIQAQIDAIEDKYERLETEAQLGTIYDAIGRIDTKLTELPFAVEKMRDRGYVHSGQLEDRLEALDDTWDDDIRPRVEAQLQEQVARLDKELDEAERHVKRINPRVESTIRSADTAVDSLERRINSVHDAIDNLYEGIENEINEIERQLRQVGSMLELLDGSQAITLREAEGPLLAVASEWHRDGEEGPEGYLFLTDQRLIFEQREEIVTKKKFGIFKADSEMVQEVHIDVEVHEIESIEHKEEGGFMGIGKDDIIEFVFAASADHSRARFHLKGQDSADWAAMLKRVQTGDIDADRSDEYLEELEEAGIVSAGFPTQCPNCFAAVPEQPRGVTSHTCEFCGAVITPESSE